MTRHLIALTLVLSLFACSDDARSGDGGGQPAPTPDFTGTFNTSGTLDLSGPIGATESVGDGVARIVVDGLVERAGAPSFIEDQVRGALEAALLEPIAAAVDSQTPPEWQIGGEQHTLLTMKLAGIEMETQLTLNGAPNALTGTERITAIRIPGEVPLSIDLTALDVDDAGVLSLDAPVTGRSSDATLTLNPHLFVVRLDQIITQILETQLEIDTGPLGAFLTGDIDCLPLLAGVGSEDGLQFSVAGQDFGFSAETVSQLCDSAVSALSGRTMGAFSKETGIEIGGPIGGSGIADDGLVNAIASRPGYGGQFTALPIPLDPTLTATFTGNRAAP